jgi:hypothetical protein
MGQAQLDRPGSSDATGYASAGAEAPAADDLLSQIAGDEIDRLLAEADIEPDTAEQRDPIAPAPPPPADAVAFDRRPEPSGPIPSSTRAAAPSPDPVPARAPATPPAKTVAPAPADPAAAANLDDLFAQLAAGDPPPQATVSAPDISPKPAIVDVPASVAAPESVTQAAINAVEADRFAGADAVGLLSELQGNASVATTDATADCEIEPDSALDPTSLDDPDDLGQKSLLTAPMAADELTGELPWYVRVLEWLNSPLAGCSDAAREAMGKIAIITALNALAVLIYVLAFRRP